MSGSRSLKQTRIQDRRGRQWTITRVPADQSDEEDFRFWYEKMTADQRVMAVYAPLDSRLKAQACRVVPLFRRFHGRVLFQLSALLDLWVSGAGLSRAASGDEVS